MTNSPQETWSSKHVFWRSTERFNVLLIWLAGLNFPKWLHPLLFCKWLFVDVSSLCRSFFSFFCYLLLLFYCFWISTYERRREGKREEERIKQRKDTVLKRVDSAYVQKTMVSKNSNSERRERNARVRSLPNQGEPKQTDATTRLLHRRETALKPLREVPNLRPRTGADRLCRQRVTPQA